MRIKKYIVRVHVKYPDTNQVDVWCCTNDGRFYTEDEAWCIAEGIEAKLEESEQKIRTDILLVEEYEDVRP